MYSNSSRSSVVRWLLLVIFIAGLMILSGCIEGPATLPKMNLSLGYATGTRTLNVVNASNMSEVLKDVCNDTGECVALACQNESGFFLWRWLGLSDVTLKGKRCDFLRCSGCTNYSEDCIERCVDDYEGVQINFMVGEGSSFGEAIYASWYLNFSFISAVKWLTPTNDSDVFYMPIRERASTALYFNKIPIYVVPKINFSSVDPIDPYSIYEEKVEELARYMSKDPVVGLDQPVGPVFIVLHESGLDHDEVWSIRRAAEKIKHVCHNCLVGIIPPRMAYNNTWTDSDDRRISEYFLNITIYGRDPSGLNIPEKCKDWNGNESVENCVDFIADGLILNELKECDGYYAARQLLIKSKVRLMKYHKPTFIIFVGGKRAANIYNTCNWTGETIGHAYNILYHDIPNLVATGTFGMHICNFNYHFNNNPYCNSEDYALTSQYYGSADFDKQPEATAWMVNHYGYYALKTINVSNKEIPLYFVSPVVFPWSGYGLSCYVRSGLGYAVIDVYYGLHKLPKEERYSFNDTVMVDIQNAGDTIIGSEQKWNGTFMPCYVHDEIPSMLKNAMSSNGTSSISIDERHNGFIDGWESNSVADCAWALRGVDAHDRSLLAEADRYDVDPFLLDSLVNTSIIMHGTDNYEKSAREISRLYYDAYYELRFNAMMNGKTFDDIGLGDRRQMEWTVLYLALFGYFNGGTEGIEDIIYDFFDRIDGTPPTDSCGDADNSILFYISNAECRGKIKEIIAMPGDEFSNPDRTISMYYAYAEHCFDYDPADPDSGYFKQCFEERADAID